MTNNNSKKWSTIGSIMLVIIFFGGYLGLFIKPNNSSNEITVSYNIIFNNEKIPTEYKKVPVDISLGSFLYNFVPGVSFESDYDLKTVNNIGNDFFNNYYWQILLNDELETNWNKILKYNDSILLFYGIPIFNLNISLHINNITEENNVLINNNMTLFTLLNSYNLTFENDTVICLFSKCNDNITSWNILINNDSIKDFNTSFNKNDNLILKYE